MKVINRLLVVPVVLGVMMGSMSVNADRITVGMVVVLLIASVVFMDTFSLVFGGDGNGIDDTVLDKYLKARGGHWVYVDPLALDLDGDGIETRAANGADTVLFDHDGDSTKHGTGWVKSDDGLLVLDRNGNGTIDAGRELFGDQTLLANGQRASDGFAALRELDSNANGVFDAQDAAYTQVRVWRDLNQDGVSQVDELKTLADTGIASLNFANNPFYREFTDTIALPDDVKALPDMGGSGEVRDLREAAFFIDSCNASAMRLSMANAI